MLLEYVPIVDIMVHHFREEWSHKLSKKLNEGVGGVLDKSEYQGINGGGTT